MSDFNFEDIDSIINAIMNDEEVPIHDEPKGVITEPVAEAVTQTDDDLNDLFNDSLADLIAGGEQMVDDGDVFKDDVTQNVTIPETLQVVEETVTVTEIPEEDSLADILASTVVEEPAPTPIEFANVKDKQIVSVPTFTSDEVAEQIDLRNFATLVTFNTGRWHGKVKDRKASASAANAAGADPLAFETQKRLLAGADEKLKAVHKAIDEARTRHYSMTLPWSTTSANEQGRRTGGRLLLNTMFNEYIAAMTQGKAAMEQALNEFVSDYAAAIGRAQSKLGSSFDPAEYPNPSSIEQHFGFSFDFHPVPIGGDFKGLADQQISKLAGALEKKNKVMLENAMAETWTRTYDLIKHVSTAFNDPKKLFHYTLIDKLRDAASNIKHFNLTNDPCIEQVRSAIETHLTRYDAEDIRKDGALRSRLGKVAAACVKEMDNYNKKGA